MQDTAAASRRAVARRSPQVAALTDSVSSRTIQVQGYEPKPDENMNPWTNEVAPDYFRTLGMPLVLGREFTERDVDGAPLVAIVNEIVRAATTSAPRIPSAAASAGAR